jgi:poly(A) polymerase Pap1
MINAGDSNILLTNYFDLKIARKRDSSLFDVEELVNEVFEGKWHGEEKWNSFVRTYTSKELQKEFFEQCIERLKKNKKKKNLTYHDIAELFGINENNMRQRIHVLGINWKEMKKL